MKNTKIFTILALLCTSLAYGQATDGTIAGQISTTIRSSGVPIQKGTLADVMDLLNLSKLNLNQNATIALTGTDNYTGTISPAITSYGSYFSVKVIVGNTNTGAATVNFNSIGIKDIKLTASTALGAGDMTSGHAYWLVWDGTRFLLTGSGGGGGGGGGSGTVTTFSSGNLSPLFTTNVANPTTAPALTFSLSTAAAHTFLGNNTAFTAAPQYFQPSYTDIAGSLSLTSTTFANQGTTTTWLNGNPSGNLTFSALPTASGSLAGVSKLYTSTGSSTDGSMDRNTITTEVGLRFPRYPSSNRVTGDYTLVLTDDAKLIETNSSSPITVTIPPQVSVAWSNNTRIEIAGYGTGGTTIAAGVGVTIRNYPGSLTLPGQYSVAVLSRIASNEWYLWNGSAAIVYVNMTNASVSSNTLTLTNMPSSAQEFPAGATGLLHFKFDGTNYLQARLVVSCTTAGSTNARFYTEWSSNDSAFTTLGTATGTQTSTIASTGTRVSDWIDLPTGAKTDVYWRVMNVGGDASADPVVGTVMIQFKGN